MTATEFTGDGLLITAQDLSVVSPTAEDNDRLYHHNGANAISLAGGASTSERGYYVWDSSAGVWSPVFNNADLLDGKESGDFVHRDGSLPMEGDLDVGHFGLLNTDSVSSGTGQLLLNGNHAIIKASSGGSNVQAKDANGLLLLNAFEGGDVDVPNGSLYEQGTRVATRVWINSNADVPNADYADEANSLDGFDQTDFLHVAGDQMTGVLDLGGFDLNDSGTVKYDASAGVFVQSALGGPASSLSSYPLPNEDISNSSITVTAGNQLTGGGTVSLGGSITLGLSEGSTSGLDADFLDGYDSADLGVLAEDQTIDGSWSFNVTPSVPENSWSETDVDYSNIPLSIPVTKWANGLSGEEIWRIELQAGESLEAHRLEIQPKGGGDVTGLEADLYEVGSSTILASTTDVTTGSPIASSADGAVVILRISNSSGSFQNASISGQLHLV